MRQVAFNNLGLTNESIHNNKYYGEGYTVRDVDGEFINEFGGNPRLASTLSILMLTVTFGALLIQRRFARRASFDQETVTPLGLRKISTTKMVIATLIVYAIVFTAFLPTLTVVVSSFLETRGPLLIGEFTFDGYLTATRLPASFRNSLVLVLASKKSSHV